MTVIPPAPTPDIIEAACDQSVLAGLVTDLGAETAGELIELFIAETRARLRRIAAPACEAGRLLRDVHTLRGGAGTVAATRLAALAHALETRLRAGGTASDTDVAALQAAFDAYTDRARGCAHQAAAASP